MIDGSRNSRTHDKIPRPRTCVGDQISSPPPKDDMVAEQSRPTCLIVALQPLVFDRARVERGRKTDAENLAAPMILQPCFAASVADDNM